MAYQGRCKSCKKVFRWYEALDTPLNRTACPECGRSLSRTTHLCKDQVVQLSEAPTILLRGRWC